LNDETVEQAIRRHERWLAEQENAIQLHTDAIRKHDEWLRNHDEWREEFWAAMRAATERGDKMDKRLDRFEREGRRRLENQEEQLRLHREQFQEQLKLYQERLEEQRKEFRDFLARFDAFLAGRGGNGGSRRKR
jgi:chromosome segregation ATPase